ncbi:parallel beta helix pectate lyase-like protein [Chitinophaga niastensis]|uniref:Parallel beta helix pectate lyase-like protein n=1 Tax=Chitinophaga niastensis TaxID=536980 RepID=A0A2P8HC09_CHINA|nr:right-handed parallel beta-helix repeat-containing protein [Chitinophaga niastensis]PSL43758.1 parallel beta helix pectate lyase-like protein [Chitinophaga niastensis]
MTHHITSRLSMLIIALALIFSLGSCTKAQLDEIKKPATSAVTPVTPPPAKGTEYTLVADKDGRLIIDASKGPYKGGDIINLKGNFSAVYISNLNGAAGNPIIIRNLSGTVTKIGNPLWSGGSWSTAMNFTNCHYIKLGGQTSRSEFIFDCTTKTGRDAYMDLTLSRHTDNFEISNITILNGGTGIWAKTDPIKGDLSTYYPNSQMENLLIHDVSISGTYNEAMYIGHTALYWNLTANAPYYGAQSGFTPGQEYVQPIKWHNVKIYNNLVKDGGKDGIQTAAMDQLEIYGNEVTNWATEHDYGNNGGILVGGRTTNTNVHDNYVHDAWGELFQFYGSGENGATHIVRNNLFRDSQGDGMSLRGTANAVIQISNNTVARVNGVLLRVNGYLGMRAPQIVKGNAFIQPRLSGATIYPNAYIYTENGGTVTEGTGKDANTRFATVAAAGVDIYNFYLPKSGSALLTTGYRKI